MLMFVASADSVEDVVFSLAIGSLVILMVVLGALISTQQPGNRVGWLLLFLGTLMAATSPTEAALDGLQVAPATVTPYVLLVLFLDNVTWVSFLLGFISVFYVFPDGRLVSRRWRWAPMLIITMAATSVMVTPLQSEIGPGDGSWTLTNPYGFIGPGALNVVGGLVVVALVTVAIGAPIAVLVRYRRSTYVGKTQIKLVLLSAVVFVVLAGVSSFSAVWDSDVIVLQLLFPIALFAPPIAITVAILRHNLFDIDIVISRSLTYGTLAVFIGFVYVGIVVGIGELLGRGDNTSFGLSIIATALVAFAFQPVRLRVERSANRLVYGERATPYEVLSRFSQRSAEMSDDELLERIPRLIADGTGASSASVWVRSGHRFRTVSEWPDSALARTAGGHGVFTDPDADYALPANHEGECLGGISLVKARGEPMRPAEIELLEKLSSGMGLALRNTLLTERLRQKVRDLKRSRDRVVRVADDARRSLEHDLDSGPQQQLVAIKVKLGPTRKLALQQGAARTATVLEDIEKQAADAIQAVRDFAGGVYPPLLEAEGLAVALTNQARKAAIPVAIDVDGVGRYPRDVESAVYFTILEALQNTAKYAGASEARINLTERDGTLGFSVSDDGRGFNMTATASSAGLTGVADRIDTVGGSWRIKSSPGSGTVVKGSVPVSEPARA